LCDQHPYQLTFWNRTGTNAQIHVDLPTLHVESLTTSIDTPAALRDDEITLWNLITTLGTEFPSFITNGRPAPSTSRFDRIVRLLRKPYLGRTVPHAVFRILFYRRCQTTIFTVQYLSFRKGIYGEKESIQRVRHFNVIHLASVTIQARSIITLQDVLYLWLDATDEKEEHGNSIIGRKGSSNEAIVLIWLVKQD